MYTELVFQGVTKDNLPDTVELLMERFFDGNDMYIEPPFYGGDYQLTLPDHDLFKCPRWKDIGRMSSFSFLPIPVTTMDEQIRGEGIYNLFLRCDLKNYDDEIELFIDWIKPYMKKCYGWIWCEEDEAPKIFKHEDY